MRELKIFEDFGYDLIDDSCLGEFWWKCPKCEHNSKDDRYNLYIQLGDTLICKKCGFKAITRSKIWMEEKK